MVVPRRVLLAVALAGATACGEIVGVRELSVSSSADASPGGGGETGQDGTPGPLPDGGGGGDHVALPEASGFEDVYRPDAYVDADGTTVVSMAGKWDGAFQSVLWNGGTNATLLQAGTSVTGTTTFQACPCFSSADAEIKLTGQGFDGTISNGNKITISGTISPDGNRMEGTIHVRDRLEKRFDRRLVRPRGLRAACLSSGHAAARLDP
jgi:hypothetical protein